MASSDHSPNDHAPGFRAIRWNIDWILRPIFGIGLAIIAIAATFALAPRGFAVLMVLLLIPAGREWHRMVAADKLEPLKLYLLTGITVASASAGLALLLSGAGLYSLLTLAAGGAVAFLVGRDGNPLWQAAGVIYLGLPALALVALRSFFPDLAHGDLAHPDPASGGRVVVGMFFIVWASDTGALIWGNLIGGPRLAPRWSPGKTWAGTIGGSLTAAIIYGCYVGVIIGTFAEAALFAFLFSAVAHGGDLLESVVKRRFGRKDSGAAIPGHGGLLDRIDSTLATSVALAILVFAFHLDPLFRAHS